MTQGYTQAPGEPERQDPGIRDVIGLTSLMVHKYYCENDVEALIAYMDPEILWFGTGEEEFAAGRDGVADIFRTFSGQVPRCVISDEEYRAIPVAPDTYLCAGRMWIATDASTRIALRVHQRITTIFRWVDGRPLCCHIHVSNPYAEMSEEDVGFPTKMARQSFQYLQEQIQAQRRQIRQQTAALRRMSYEDSLTGVYNRNRFNLLTEHFPTGVSSLGVLCMDLNGLKQINDQQGHSAGDDLIRQAAQQMWAVFPKKVYRTGGDEFVVVARAAGEDAFFAQVKVLRDKLDELGIQCAMGASWHAPCLGLKEQFDEADRLMYQEKRRFYSQAGHDRRRRPE